MNARLTLSVITPSYNYERYLPTCLASVVRQERSNFDVQHVVIDDGSQDDSWQVIERLHPIPDRDCHRQQNRGLSATLNRTLELAHGEWVVWLNADDFLLPWALRTVSDVLERHADVDIVFGDTLFVDSESRLMRMVSQPSFHRRLFEGGYNSFHTPSVFWRRCLLPEGWRFDESMRLLMDLDLWLTVTRRARSIAKVDSPLSAFRRHPAQASASEYPGDAAEMRVIARKHGLMKLESAATARQPAAAKGAHALWKAVELHWIRELSVRRFGGMPTDWTRGHDVSRLRSPRPRARLRPSARGARSVGSWGST